jgi:hypothetical protein
MHVIEAPLEAILSMSECEVGIRDVLVDGAIFVVRHYRTPA